MTVGLVRTEWSGTSGGPGVSVMCMSANAGGDWTPTQAQSAVDKVRTFWSSIAGQLPDDVTVKVSPVVDLHDQANGSLTNTVVAATAPVSVVGSSTGAFAAGCGCKVTWETGSILRGRRVRGTTYIVPLSAGAYDADGTIAPANITAIAGAAGTLVSGLSASSLGMVVWSRPNPVKGYTGLLTSVISARVNDKTAILRSRRD